MFINYGAYEINFFESTLFYTGYPRIRRERVALHRFQRVIVASARSRYRSRARDHLGVVNCAVSPPSSLSVSSPTRAFSISISCSCSNCAKSSASSCASLSSMY